jgi:hypothetical protein
MKLARLALHLCLIAIVVIVPPAFYDFASSRGWPSAALYLGASTYPLYLGYWIWRIPGERWRVVATDALAFALCVAVITLGYPWIPAGIGVFAPLFGLLPALAWMCFRYVQHQPATARAHRLALLLLLPVALVLTGLFLFGYAMSGAPRHD